MNLLLGALQNLWNNFYNTCVRNVDNKVRYSVGIALIVAALLTFVACSKGKNKGMLINNWFLFWISMIFLIAGVLYMSI
ncbi:MAG: hypothetical protein SPK63_03345 [Eubacteriales bacterium]|nr:hypothetical protein [Eubacteriales bacterium]